MKWWD